jgi:hypothetical protein
MAISDHPPGTLEYGHGRTGAGRSPRTTLPRTFVLASLLPIGAFIAIALTAADHWSRWFQIGQGWERITGILWLATAVYDLSCLVMLAFVRKRWDVWVALLLHGAWVVLTLFPGFFAIAWLMHWGPSGPGS